MNSFGGIITQVITATNDPRFHVGQAFSGYYQYDATTANGTFYCVPSLANPGENSSLTGLVYLALADGSGGLTALPHTPNQGQLTVAGGAVTGFAWSTQMGDYYAEFTATTFSAKFLNEGGDILTSGTVNFSRVIVQA